MSAIEDQAKFMLVFKQSEASISFPLEVCHALFMTLVDTLFSKDLPAPIKENIQALALNLLSRIIQVCPESIPLYMVLIKRHTIRITNLSPDGTITLFNGQTFKGKL